MRSFTWTIILAGNIRQDASIRTICNHSAVAEGTREATFAAVLTAIASNTSTSACVKPAFRRNSRCSRGIAARRNWAKTSSDASSRAGRIPLASIAAAACRTELAQTELEVVLADGPRRGQIRIAIFFCGHSTPGCFKCLRARALSNSAYSPSVIRSPVRLANK
jgi:hypothetical protein